MTNAKAPRRASGQPVTDQLVASLADEAEAGYDPETLRRKGGRRPIGSAAAKVIPVRLDPSSRRPCANGPRPITPTPARSFATRCAPGCEAPDWPRSDRERPRSLVPFWFQLCSIQGRARLATEVRAPHLTCADALGEPTANPPWRLS